MTAGPGPLPQRQHASLSNANNRIRTWCSQSQDKAGAVRIFTSVFALTFPRHYLPVRDLRYKGSMTMSKSQLHFQPNMPIVLMGIAVLLVVLAIWEKA